MRILKPMDGVCVCVCVCVCCVCLCVCVEMVHVQTYKISWPSFYAIFRHPELFCFFGGGMLRRKEQNMH